MTLSALPDASEGLTQSPGGLVDRETFRLLACAGCTGSPNRFHNHSPAAVTHHGHRCGSVHVTHIPQGIANVESPLDNGLRRKNLGAIPEHLFLPGPTGAHAPSHDQDGSTVMVNRGHLAAHRLDRATRPEVPTSGSWNRPLPAACTHRSSVSVDGGPLNCAAQHPIL